MPEEEEESLHLPGAVSTDGPAKKSGSKKKSGTPTKTKSKKKGKGRNEEEGGGHAGEDEGGPILPGSAMPSPGKLAPIELKRKKVPDEGLLTGGSIRETALDEAGSAVANGRGDPGAHQAQAVVGDISNRGGDAEHETAEKSVDPAPPLPPSAQNNQAAQQQQQQHNQHNQQGALDFDLEAAGVTMEKDDFEGFHQKSRPSFFTTAKTIVGMGLGKRRGSASNVVSADQSRRDGKSIPSSDNEIRSWARRPSAQSGFTATDNEGSMSTSGLARRRWKKAGNVIAALNATSGDRTKIDQETMMTLLSGNMARRMGEHAFKTRLIEMTGDEIDKLLANVTIEGFIRQIMEEFAEQQRRKKSKGQSLVLALGCQTLSAPFLLMSTSYPSPCGQSFSPSPSPSPWPSSFSMALQNADHFISFFFFRTNLPSRLTLTDHNPSPNPSPPPHPSFAKLQFSRISFFPSTRTAGAPST
jgi:hypothetical protein